MRTVGLLKNGKVAQVTNAAAKAEKPKKPSGSKKDAATGKTEKPNEQKPETPANNEGENPEQKDAATGKAATDGNEGE